MTHTNFQTFCESLLGDWSGQRRNAEFEREAVRSQWQLAFDGGYLQEHWHTAGTKDTPEWTAEAFFRMGEAGPGDFIAVYRHGKMAYGESEFGAGQWSLTHRWLREPGVAIVRLRFLDTDTYEQEVLEVGADGALIPESLAIMKRERLTTHPA